ncbi:carboxymuconolactone decarboxylase family protein [Trabulsiella odontotermitis]|uniref:Alkylhydroperoxidase n=1 Tax=Trabulsiella odontotermitis TaxID=379893 RepID=A0A0L0GM27_9ENTR|nr:carboxymuconolactone decarboxylase family protein [Trabulsiella odontotermitis]KNC90095.1 alkylhydroperoxidase [Trabulsiella odontotermitis]KNC91422.1 alkylhydroperoxidase [Trabulsiella odontotermitis]
MSTRVNHFKVTPALVKSLSELSMATGNTSIAPTLKHLIDIRVSQLNGCTFCLDMHTKEAKIDGERELRIYHLSAWRESPLFSAREKAALAFAEALTRINEHGVSDALYRSLAEHFSETEIAELNFVIAVINTWNRLQITSRAVPGSMDAAYGLNKANLE